MQQPTVYDHRNVYDNGGGGPAPEFDGVFPNLVISTENKQSGNKGGVRQSNNDYRPIADKIKWSLTKETAVDITNFNTLVWKFKFYLSTNANGNQFNYLFGSNNADQIFFQQFSSAYNFTFFLKKANNTTINSWNLGEISKWNWHFIECILNRSTNKLILKIDGVNKINDTVDFSQIDATNIIPSYGCSNNGTTCWLHQGVFIGREMSLKIDGEEKF